MLDREFVNQDDLVLITKGCHVKSSASKNPRKSSKTDFVTLAELFALDFATKHPYPDDAYTMPGVHKNRAYRYLADDSRGEFKDDFKFYLLPFDLDIHGSTGRNVWQSYSEARHTIDQLLIMSPFLKENAACIATSKGGVRIFIVLSQKVNALEWITIRDYVQRQLNKELNCYLKKFKKVRKFCFYCGPKQLVFDTRSVASLTRVPFGFRDGAPVVEQPYFAHRTLPNVRMDIDVHFKRLVESDLIERRGYHTDRIVKKCPEKRAKLPETLKPYRWLGDEPPGSGERDTALFTAICHAKRKFADRLTPEQYLSYFWDAIKMIHVEPGENWFKIAWSMITRDFLFKSKARTSIGHKRDHLQMRNSGNKPFYPATDYDSLLRTEDVFDYSDQKMHEMLATILNRDKGAVFLNPPPGAGKSEIAIEFLSRRDGIFIAKTNDHLKSISARLERDYIEHSVIGSNRWIIEEYFSDDEHLRNVYDFYTMHYEEKKASEVFLVKWHQKYRSGKFGIKPFYRYLIDNHPELTKQAELLNRKATSTKRRLFQKRGVTLITHKKLLSMLTTKNYTKICRPIIFDEAEPKDVSVPGLYTEQGPIEIYGSWQKPQSMSVKDQQQQYIFTEILHMQYSIFINASKGLGEALKHNNYLDILILGADMKAVYDEDLKIVLSPDLRSGYTPYRASSDDQELSPRALYCDQFKKRVNQNVYTCVVNGGTRKGDKLSDHNLANVIGSNALINSKVVSIITYPAVQQVAEMVFCTGVTVQKAVKILVENTINQTISRNTGYRCFDSTKRYAELKDRPDKNEEKNNTHICVLPQSMLVVDPQLIVRTPLVYTDMSSDPLCEVQPFLSRINTNIKLKIAMYNVKPGTYTTVSDIAKECRISIRRAIPMVQDLLEDRESFSDFSLWKVARVDKTHRRNVIRREENIKMSIQKVLNNMALSKISQLGYDDFLEKLRDESSKKHINSFAMKPLKEMIRAYAYRFEYRQVMHKHKGYLVRTGAQFYFPVPELDIEKLSEITCN